MHVCVLCLMFTVERLSLVSSVNLQLRKMCDFCNPSAQKKTNVIVTVAKLRTSPQRRQQKLLQEEEGNH